MFEGAKMYADHLAPEAQKALAGMPRSVRDVMGRIVETAYLAPGETHVAEDGGESMGTNDSNVAVIRGRASIAQPWLYELVEHDPELIGVSINARGSSKTGKVNGRSAKMVEAISRVASVDWVTEAGAGGRVKALVEAQVAAEAEEAAEEQVAEDGQDDVPESQDDTRGQDDQDTAGTRATDHGNSSAASTRGQNVGATEADADAEDVDKELDWEDVEESEDEDATAFLDAEPVLECDDCGHVQESGSFCSECGSSDLTEAAAPTPGAGAQSGGLDPAKWGPKFGKDNGGRQPGDIGYMGSTQHASGNHTDDVLTDFIGNASIPSASELAAAIEAEVERRTGERLEEAVEAAVEKATADIKADADRRVEQVRQRYAAIAAIEAAQDLPEASRKALKRQFHDVFAEAKLDEDGKTVLQEADSVLKQSVAAAIDEKRAELNPTEVQMTEAGDTQGAREGNAGSEPPADRKAPKRAPADEKINERLGI
jgi:hypothetical protein